MTNPASPSNPAADDPRAGCVGEGCITCGDYAVQATVLELLGDDFAIVNTDLGQDEVSVALINAKVGDIILVHAGEAIAVVGG